MSDALFVAWQAAFIVFGLPAFYHPLLRRLSLPARLSAAFLLGALMLSVWATLLALAGVRWRLWLLGGGLLVIAVALSVWAWRQRRGAGLEGTAGGAPRVAAAVLILLALAHFTFQTVTGRSSSPDFLLFWGVKALRFAELGGFDEELARWAFAIHTHPNYPPLYPLTLVWGILTTGQLPWVGAYLTSVIWLAVVLPLLYGLLALRINATRAMALTAFWAVAMSASLARSFSAGNPEAMLVAYFTIAVACLVIEWRDDALDVRWIAGLAIAGAALTKFEGLIGWGVMAGATVARDLLWRKPGLLRRTFPLILVPALAYGLWATYLLANDIPLGDPTRNPPKIHLTYLVAVLREMFDSLGMGSFGLAWLLPPILLRLTRDAQPRTEWTMVLPAVGLAAGLLLAFFFYYLLRPYDPSIEIAWTLPRLAQPALSAWILAVGMILSRREPARLTGR